VKPGIFLKNKIAWLGNWLAQHQSFIRRTQWIIIIAYAFLIIVPVFLPLPDDSATLFHNLTVFAEFVFWGIWWPFVLLSIILFGRLWCGVLCPEGALSEFANKYGRERRIPKWLRWGGWPFVAFALTTLYGQMTSVYQYPKPVLLILGGSTLAAIVVGFLYGKSNRVWCKYLCPVTGVFAVLAKLAPWRYKPMEEQWSRDQIKQINVVRCPTLLPLTKMTSAANCLMCGKCGNSNGAIQLTARSPHEEIVVRGAKKNSTPESILIIFGLCGLALAAFQWTNSFWLQHARDVIDSWFLIHNINWVFNTNTPWWIFTNYPERGDVFSWLYGAEVVSYIVIVGFAIGIISTTLISLAVKCTGHLSLTRFNHLAQSLIPLGGCSVFVGLFANTINILQKYADIAFWWINYLKGALLILATLWSFYLAFKIIQRYTVSIKRRMMSLAFMLINFAVINYSWILVLHVWAIKSDRIPWNTLWVW
jgi:hypothetical protein